MPPGAQGFVVIDGRRVMRRNPRAAAAVWACEFLCTLCAVAFLTLAAYGVGKLVF